MAKKATGRSSAGSAKKTAKPHAANAKGREVTRVSSGGRRSSSDDQFKASDAFIKLLQSPLVAELVAVAATAALASLAENGFTSGSGTRGKRAGKAVKEAGKAAAAAVGRRLGTEIDEIRKASGASKGSAKA